MILLPHSSMFDAEIKTNATLVSTFCIVCLIRIPLLLYSYYTIHFSNKDRCILQSVKTVKTDPNNPGLYSLCILLFPSFPHFVIFHSC